MKEDLRLGLVGPSLARQLTRLPVGNQEALLALARRATLTTPEVSGVIDLLVGASAEQAAFVLAQPREALAQVQGMPVALRDPRLSRAGNWLARHLRRRRSRSCASRTGCARRMNGSYRRRIVRSCNPCSRASAIRQAWWRSWCWGRTSNRTDHHERSDAVGDRAASSERDVATGIADELGISRCARATPLARVQARERPSHARAQAASLKSIIDPYEPILQELLAKYPNITTERAVQELQARGFTGKYTVVHRRLRLLRPRATPARVPRH